MEVARTVLTMALGIALPLCVQLWDKRRLSDEQRERAWNLASWCSALYAFGPLSMLGWVHVTRLGAGRFLGAPLGVMPVLLVLWLADALVGWQLGEPIAWLDAGLMLAIGSPACVLVMLVVEVISRGWRALKRRSAALRTFVAMLALSLVWLAGADDALALEPLAYGGARPLPAGRDGWAVARIGGVRGVTVGPIESALHPNVGYGTAAGRSALSEARALGANWVALTPFGRVWDLRGGGVDLTFEEPVAENRRNVLAAMRDAHERGLYVFLVPHLWVETGGWRALIDPGDDKSWSRWAASYRHFLLYWADVAARGHAEMFSIGVELRSWATTERAPSLAAIIAEVRARYGGLITYSANWDDVEHTVILGDLDVIGVNAFYPLTAKEGARFEDLLEGGKRVSRDLGELARAWNKPVLLTEMGYTTRADPALRPWEWPDGMRDVRVDQQAQALAYRALLAPLLEESWCAGFFAWRTYADPQDVSQEAEWGFSPRGKLAELTLRDAFAARWAADGGDLWLGWAAAHRARTPGVHRWEASPPLSEWLIQE